MLRGSVRSTIEVTVVRIGRLNIDESVAEAVSDTHMGISIIAVGEVEARVDLIGTDTSIGMICKYRDKRYPDFSSNAKHIDEHFSSEPAIAHGPAPYTYRVFDTPS